MMKKLISAILLLALLCSCSSDSSEKDATYKLFYANSSNLSEIVSVDTTLNAANTEDAIVELFSKLVSPESKAHLSVIPKSVDLVESSFIGGTCSLTLSAPYRKLSPHSLVTVNFVLVSTMSGLPDVKQISITSENVTETFNTDEFITSAPPAYYDSHTVTLRYLTSDFAETVNTQKTFVHEDGKALETYVAELLATKPENPDLRSPFPDGTRINSVYLDGTTCVLDLSPEFVTVAPHTTEAETAILSSIVDTFTDLPDVNRVKFLINGKNGYGYIFYDIAFPLESLSPKA